MVYLCMKVTCLLHETIISLGLTWSLYEGLALRGLIGSVVFVDQ